MAELLVLAVNRTHPDPEKDRRGLHKKGDIIVVKPDGHTWGAGEGLPTFVRVLCPGLDHTLVEDRVQPWRYDIDFTVVASNLAIDGFRLRATNATQAPNGAGALARDRVEAFLTRWGADIVANTATSVTFDVGIFNVASSIGFWDMPLTGVSFTEQSYVQATGVHTVVVDYTQAPQFVADPVQTYNSIAQRAVQRGAEIVSHTPGILTVGIERLDVRERFRADVTEKLGTYRRHRYHFTEAQVDTAVAQGGVITVTPVQLANAVQDRQAA